MRIKLPGGTKKTFILAMGVGAGSLVQLIFTPFLARIYSPAEFGYLALFTSIVSTITVISCLRFEGAIQVVEEGEVKATVSLSLLTAFIVCILQILALFTGIPQVHFESLINLKSSVWLAPMVAMAGGIVLIVTNVTLRQGNYARNALARSSTAITFVTTAILFPHFGLVNASIASSLSVGFLCLVYIVVKTWVYVPGKLINLARKLIQYPLMLAPTSLLDTISLALPIFFISGSYGMQSAGYYFQIQKLIGAPVILLGILAGQLFSKYSAELFRSGKSSRILLWKTVGILTIASATTSIFIALYGQIFCQYILGDNWRVDTLFIYLAVIPCLVRSIVSPISFVFLAYNKIKYLVVWQVAYFFASYGILLYAARTMQFDNFLISYTIVDSLMYLLYLLLAHHASGTRKNYSE